MIYIRNCSNKIIHLGSIMLLPDQKTPDEFEGKKHSESPIIKMFIEKHLLEMVDIRPAEKANQARAEIKVEYEEVPEQIEDVKKETEPEKEPEIESDSEAEIIAPKPTSNRGRKPRK